MSAQKLSFFLGNKFINVLRFVGFYAYVPESIEWYSAEKNIPCTPREVLIWDGVRVEIGRWSQDRWLDRGGFPFTARIVFWADLPKGPWGTLQKFTRFGAAE